VADELAWEINDRILPVLQALEGPAQRICASLLCFIGMASEDRTRGWILVRMIPVVGGPLNDRMRRACLRQTTFKRGVDKGRFSNRFNLRPLTWASAWRQWSSAAFSPSVFRQAMPRTAVAMFMRSLGIDAKEARRIAAMPLPLLHSDNLANASHVIQEGLELGLDPPSRAVTETVGMRRCCPVVTRDPKVSISWLSADCIAFRAASGPIETPSARMRRLSVRPKRPKTARRDVS